MKIFICPHKDECSESILYNGKNCSQYQCFYYRFKNISCYDEKTESLSDYVNRKTQEDGSYGFGHI